MLSISTNWNSRRHETGEALLDEIAGFGLSTVELGYALTARQAPPTDNKSNRIRRPWASASAVSLVPPAVRQGTPLP